jgi:hypothetical protein
LVNRLTVKNTSWLCERATENGTAVRALLSDRSSAGLHTNGCILVVIDGAGALRKAVDRAR